MFATSAPILPPPSTSLLPPVHDRFGSQDSFGNNASIQNRATRNRGGHGQHHSLHYGQHQSHIRPSPLAQLSLDERTIVQRKLAIAMYGYSWLKPAGCNKTMLGRREEEIEREEVERQLREVEMQERNALEVEEQERRTRLDEQARREREGETLDTTGEDGDGERNLDDEVPDMDALEDEEDQEEEDEVDLDDEVPDADSNWAYDTTRDPDADSIEGDVATQAPSQLHDPLRSHAAAIPTGNHFGSFEEEEQAEQDALINEMLDEDELGAFQRDLDDDVPDMDADMDIDLDEVERDLDGDIPEAEVEDDSWEHTDTELEESEMDISILPPPPAVTGPSGRGAMLPPPSSSAGREHRQQNRVRYSTLSDQSIGSDQRPVSGIRRISGNALPSHAVNGGMAASGSGIPSVSQTGRQAGQQNATAYASGRPRRMMHTPGTVGSELSVSALISTGNSEDTGGQGNRSRGWLNPAGARRNLFGVARSISSSGGTTTSMATRNMQTRNASAAAAPGNQVSQSQGLSSSGGLFTPGPQHTQATEAVMEQRGGLGRRNGESSDTPADMSTSNTRTRHGRG